MLMLSRTKIVVSISKAGNTQCLPVHLLSNLIRLICWIRSMRLPCGFHAAVLSVSPLAMGIVPSFDAFVYAKTDTSYEICVTETPAADSC